MTASLRRTLAVAAVLFVLIFAFLAGRVRAGAEPAQVTAPAAEAVQPATPAPQTDPYDGLAPGAPPQSAVPGQDSVPSPGGQELDPPVTQAS